MAGTKIYMLTPKYYTESSVFDTPCLLGRAQRLGGRSMILFSSVFRDKTHTQNLHTLLRTGIEWRVAFWFWLLVQGNVNYSYYGRNSTKLNGLCTKICLVR